MKNIIVDEENIFVKEIVNFIREDESKASLNGDSEPEDLSNSSGRLGRNS